MQPGDSRRQEPGGASPLPIAPLAVTMGDPAGIGFDILIAAWQARATSFLPHFVFFGDPDALLARARALGVDLPVRIVSGVADVGDAGSDAIAVVPVALAVPAVAGKPDAANGAAVIQSIETAVAALAHGEASAVVTNPISKETLYRAGFRHPGHTEFLGVLAERHAREAGCTWSGTLPSDGGLRPVMMLAAAELRVVPLTVHVPLASVPGRIAAADIIATVRITSEALARDFDIPAPRIAVAGLNPHAGEGGTIGDEETRIIGPAIELLRREGIDVRGPLSADTMFHAAARASYDAAVCMYHDQALIPIKTLAFDRGVNVTLGLPFVRTSPDHGTAFDIAGSGRASATSLIEAMRLAARLAATRGASRAR